MTLVLPPGQQHEARVFAQHLASGAVKRGGPGRPKRRPHRLVGDQGHSSGRIRQYARQQGIRMSIPRKRNDHRPGLFDRAIDRLRNRIKRLINRCKQFRLLATRDEKRAVNYKAMWLIAATIVWRGIL